MCKQLPALPQTHKSNMQTKQSFDAQFNNELKLKLYMVKEIIKEFKEDIDEEHSSIEANISDKKINFYFKNISAHLKQKFIDQLKSKKPLSDLL